MTYTGTILVDGCDAASGSFSSSTGLNGSFSAYKTADTPDLNPTESTTAIAWWSEYPTYMLYEEKIGSSKSMAGRQVYEVAGTVTDTCWFSGSTYTYADLTGGGWYVGFYSTNSGSQSYFSDTLYWNVPDNVNYGVAKNNVQAWRTYP